MRTTSEKMAPMLMLDWPASYFSRAASRDSLTPLRRCRLEKRLPLCAASMMPSRTMGRWNRCAEATAKETRTTTTTTMTTHNAQEEEREEEPGG